MAPTSDREMQALFERLALEAGAAILDIFHRPAIETTEKADHSPVTEADRRAEAIILRGLRESFPAIPCVAEEETAAGRAPRDPGSVFFLVDPLDGTREFINRRPDFTVNIAFVRDGVPECGVVYAPAGKRFFSARPDLAEALDVSPDGRRIVGRRPVRVRDPASPLAIVASRSHRTPETDRFISGCGRSDIVSIGSSLKFCLLACGEADLYPRFGRTMEWDTAAGDAVLRAAGGMTRDLEGKPLRYGKGAAQTGEAPFANPFFIAATPGGLCAIGG